LGTEIVRAAEMSGMNMSIGQTSYTHGVNIGTPLTGEEGWPIG